MCCHIPLISGSIGKTSVKTVFARDLSACHDLPFAGFKFAQSVILSILPALDAWI